MYSKSQITGIRKRMNYGHNIEEMSQSYRALVSIFHRERRKELNDINKVRRRRILLLRELRKECQYFLSYLQNNLYGNKQDLKCILQNRSLHLSFQHLLPEEVIEYFKHSNNKKQTIIDLLKYRIKLRMQVYKNLKLEKANLDDNLENQNSNLKVRRTMQILNSKIQLFIVRQNAVAEIQKLYKTMVDLLHNDSHYLDAMLAVLHMDCEEQCRCVLRAAEVGRVAQGELSIIQSEYNWLETEVKVHGREREKQVRVIRKSALELKSKCRFLCRADSTGSIYKPRRRVARSTTFSMTPDDITDLEMIMESVKEATSSPTFQDIFPRMIQQMELEQVLYKQSQQMAKLRNKVLHMKHHSETILAFLQHQHVKSSTRFAEQRGKLQQEIHNEKYRLKAERDAVQSNGEMLSTLKSVLSSLFETLNRIQLVNGEFETYSTSSDVDSNDEPKNLKEAEKTLLPPVDRNPEHLLDFIEGKLRLLLAHSVPKLDKEMECDVKVWREHEVLTRRMSLAEKHENRESVTDESFDDITIMSRYDVKRMSKTLVDKQLHLIAMAHRGYRGRRRTS